MDFILCSNSLTEVAFTYITNINNKSNSNLRRDDDGNLHTDVSINL